MQKIEQLMHLLENNSSSVLLKSKLQLISDLYDECKNSENDTTVQIVREIVENFCEMISILEYNKNTASDDCDINENESFFPSLYYLTEHYPETDQQIIDAFIDYMDYSALNSPRHTPMSEATVKDYLKRLRRYARECENISLLQLYNEIETHVAKYYADSQRAQRNKKMHGAEIACLKKLRDMKSHINDCRIKERLFQDMTAYICENYTKEDDAEPFENDDIYGFSNFSPIPHGFMTAKQEEAFFNSINKKSTAKSFNDIFWEYVKRYQMNHPDQCKTVTRFSEKVLHIRRNLYYSMIDLHSTYHPNKKTVFQVSIALNLTLEETELLLAAAGFCFCDNDRFDLAIRYFIESRCFNYDDINYALDKAGLPQFEKEPYKTKRDLKEEEFSTKAQNNGKES